MKALYCEIFVVKEKINILQGLWFDQISYIAIWLAICIYIKY